MYPTGELKALERERNLVRLRIARHRAQCVANAQRVAQPLQWVNRAHGEFRKFSGVSGLIAGPVGLFAIRALTKRMGKFGTLVRWGPLIFTAAKSFLNRPPRPSS